MTPRRFALSSGFGNLVLAPLGALPMCHGAGGLAAHYRFGARSGTAPLLLGLALLALALLIFLAFVAIAFSNNVELFLSRFHTFFWLVVGHNLIALGLGYAMARMMKLDVPDRRAVTLEVGIQNSGLGLVILFTFFPDAGGMMLITAFWGVWHLVSGLTLAQIWARRPGPPVNGTDELTTS